MSSNLERMIRLAEEFFATKNDPNQISVTPEVIARLRLLHPATLSQHDDGRGPVAWMLVIPTTTDLMKAFIASEINEQELLERTQLQGSYEAIYLCSALVLPEHRGRGLAKRLAIEAVKSIQHDHPINSLFYWAFSPEGMKLAASIARELHLPLYHKQNRSDPA
jgi:GNAT superfamily N-acetyltransferase